MSARWWAALALAVGLLLGWLLWGRGRVPDAGLIARIDTVLVAAPAVHDSIRVYVGASRAERDTAAARAVRAEAAVQEAERLRREQAARLAAGDTAGALAACQVRATALDSAGREWAEALAHCGKAREAADSAATLAAGRLWQVEGLLGEARGALARVRPMPRWTAGVLWELGSPVPVGGWLQRRLGPLSLLAEATGDSRGHVTARIGVGILH